MPYRDPAALWFSVTARGATNINLLSRFIPAKSFLPLTPMSPTNRHSSQSPTQPRLPLFLAGDEDPSYRRSFSRPLSILRH